LKEELLRPSKVEDSPGPSQPQPKKRKSTYELEESPCKKVIDAQDPGAILTSEFALQCLYNFLNKEKVCMEEAHELRHELVNRMNSSSQEVRVKYFSAK
jgi:hypothetical protein